MVWFPLFLDLAGKPCLIAGGGRTALQKAEKLLEAGARLRVVSPVITPALRRLPLEFFVREVEAADVRGMALVVDATGSAAVAELLQRECAAQNIPLNVVDQPERCSVIFPAILRRGPLVAGISTGGASPLAAAWARDRLEECLPENLEGILAQMQTLRAELKRRIPEQPRRAACLRQCLAAALEGGGPLAAEELERLVRGAEAEKASGTQAMGANAGAVSEPAPNAGAQAENADAGQEASAPRGFVWLVGAGCADRELITLRGLRAMQQADLILYDDLLPDGLLELAPRAEKIYTGKRSGRHSMPQEEIARLLVSHAQAGRRVCRLKGGDPFVFGRGGEEALALKQAGIPYEIVPGVSSAIAVPARAGIPVTHRGLSRGFHVVTAHTADGLREDLSRLAAEPDTLVFLMGLAQLDALAAGLLAAGKPGDTPAAVLGDITVRARLDEIADTAREVRPPAVIVVGPAAALDLRPEGRDKAMRVEEKKMESSIIFHDIKHTMKDIEDITRKLGCSLSPESYYIEDAGCPHKPTSLPKGYAAVYIFAYKSKGDYEYLKIGKANANSAARFTSQHYGFSAQSTLAKSICNDVEFRQMGISKENIKEWMLNNLYRINILISAEEGKAVTELIEAVLHYKFRPRYEGSI